MASPYSIVAAAVQQVIETEFAAEGFTCIRDNLHESLGMDRVDIGIAPVDEASQNRNAIVQETFVELRFYDLWTPEISPTTVVDPTKITDYAQRFRAALGRAAANDPGLDQVWYFDVVRTAYPNDPTGNKTRFHATIRAYGANAGLVETSA